jgi:hypothetical protein
MYIRQQQTYFGNDDADTLLTAVLNLTHSFAQTKLCSQSAVQQEVSQNFAYFLQASPETASFHCQKTSSSLAAPEK